MSANCLWLMLWTSTSALFSFPDPFVDLFVVVGPFELVELVVVESVAQSSISTGIARGDGR